VKAGLTLVPWQAGTRVLLRVQSEGGINSGWCILGGNHTHLLRKGLCSQKKKLWLKLEIRIQRALQHAHSLKNGIVGTGGTGGQTGAHFLFSQSCASMGIRSLLLHTAHPPTLDSL
jgi:hypothetical protein